MYKIMKKKCIKSYFKAIVLKLATIDRSDKMFLLTSKFHPQGVVSPCPGAIYVYKIMKKKCIKSDLEEIYLKLVANDRSDKWFLLTSKFYLLGLSAPQMQIYAYHSACTFSMHVNSMPLIYISATNCPILT